MVGVEHKKQASKNHPMRDCLVLGNCRKSVSGDIRTLGIWGCNCYIVLKS